MKIWWQFGVVLLLSATGAAAEIAVLRNGYNIRHETRQEIGELTRLYISADRTSFIDIPTADIEQFDKDDSPVLPVTSTDSRGTAPSIVSPSGVRKTTPKASPQEIADAIGSASTRYHLDPDFVSSVMSAESGFNSRAVSRKGAQGLMQLMPGTASQLGVDNAFDPAKNADGGTRYLRMLLERFHFDVAKALAAYNAGPSRVDQHNGVPPYVETRKYVARIINDYNRKKLAQQKPSASQTATYKVKPQETPAPGTGVGAQTKPAGKANTVDQAKTLHRQ
jgi:hypothetical protein